MIVLHVGLPKTGTTAFQEALIRHRDTLQERGIHLPFETTLGPHALAARLIKGGLSARSDIAELAQTPCDYWFERHDPFKCCVLWSEYFWHCEPNALRDYFRMYDQDVRVMFIARSQGPGVLSGYGQDVAWLSSCDAITEITFNDDLDFERLHHRYAAALGADSVICDWYENLIATRKTTLSLLIENIGGPVSHCDEALTIAVADQTPANPSVPSELVDLLRYCNEARLPRCKAHILSGALRIQSQFEPYRADLADAITAIYAASNIRFSRQAGLSIPPQARATTPQGFRPMTPLWPPRLEGRENLYAFMQAFESQLVGDDETTSETPSSAVRETLDQSAAEMLQ